MIDEMICAIDSPGSVSTVAIIPPEIREDARGRQGPQERSVPRVFGCLSPVLVGCGVRLGHQLAAASLSNESANSMPIPNSE
jgi:hypothetical protein